MSGRMHFRARDRGSPGRRRPSVERGKIDHFHRRDRGSPDRSKRGRWESPSRDRTGSPGRMWRRDFESPPRASRRNAISPPKSRRSGFDDGPRLSFGEHRSEEEYRFRIMHQDGCREAPRPAGLIFLCSSSMLRECFHFRVLGLPAAEIGVVERVVPGTKLFLLNFDTKELFGVFEAASHGGLNLVPEAFLDSKGTYAAQVRFNIFREYLPLADDIVRDVLRENFSQRGRFDCELSADQVLTILQLFSPQEMHPGGPGQVREKHGHDNRVNALDLDGRRFLSSSLEGSHVLEDKAFQQSQLLMNRAHVESANPPAVILGQARIEEVDQLALKYLQNNPGFSGLGLETANTNLLSTSLRNNPQTSFSNTAMDHDPATMPIGGNLVAINLQSNGVPFPAVGGGIPNPRLLGNPGSSASDMEHPGVKGGKMMGHFTLGSFGTERGLLPIPGMHHDTGMPQPGFLLQPGQPGMMHPFLPSAAAPGAFPMGAGLLGGPQPEFGRPVVPFQGPHMFPLHQMVDLPNNGQVANSKVANVPKKNKQMERSIHQKVLTGQRKRSKHQKVLTGDNTDKKDDAVPKAADSTAA